MKDLFSTAAEVRQAEQSAEEIHRELAEDDNSRSWFRAERLWKLKEHHGESDERIGDRHGWSRQYVNSMRTVWEMFAAGDRVNPGVDRESLTFKHFRTAMAWPDAPECLAWAVENEASSTEMTAWRRAQHGEDLTAGSSDTYPKLAEPADPTVETHEKPPSVVVSPPREKADDYGETKPPAEKPRTDPPKPVPETPEPHLTLTDIRRLLVAAEDTSGDVREQRKFAAWHRKRAEELDPIGKASARPASLDEVAEFIAAENLQVEPQRWWDHYQSNGWKVGKNPMRDWRAAVRNAHRQGWASGTNGGQTGSLTGSLNRFLERRGSAK